MMLLMSIAEQLEILWIAMLTSVGQDFGLLKGGMIGSVADWIGTHIFWLGCFQNPFDHLIAGCNV